MHDEISVEDLNKSIDQSVDFDGFSSFVSTFKKYCDDGKIEIKQTDEYIEEIENFLDSAKNVYKMAWPNEIGEINSWKMLALILSSCIIED